MRRRDGREAGAGRRGEIGAMDTGSDAESWIGDLSEIIGERRGVGSAWSSP